MLSLQLTSAQWLPLTCGYSPYPDVLAVLAYSLPCCTGPSFMFLVIPVLLTRKSQMSLCLQKEEREYHVPNNTLAMLNFVIQIYSKI